MEQEQAKQTKEGGRKSQGPAGVVRRNIPAIATERTMANGGRKTIGREEAASPWGTERCRAAIEATLTSAGTAEAATLAIFCMAAWRRDTERRIGVGTRRHKKTRKDTRIEIAARAVVTATATSAAGSALDDDGRVDGDAREASQKSMDEELCTAANGR